MANTPITIGYAGVTQPGANGTPNIIGPDAIRAVSYTHLTLPTKA